TAAVAQADRVFCVSPGRARIASLLRRDPRRRPFHHHERDGLADRTDHDADPSVVPREGLIPSLRANGSRECAPDDRLREAIHAATVEEWIASSLALLAMTVEAGRPLP